jgi:hypothetical protein
MQAGVVVSKLTAKIVLKYVKSCRPNKINISRKDEKQYALIGTFNDLERTRLEHEQ